MRILLLAYDFPHRQSCEFVLRMAAAGFQPDVVVGAPWQKLEQRTSRIVTRHAAIDPPRVADVCRILGIQYEVSGHSPADLASILGRDRFDLGVVAGARILKPDVLRQFGIGVLNIHPGLIPENRGLDNISYAIYRDLPMAITAHFVDERVDAGLLIDRYLVPVRSTDELIDVGMRVFEAYNLVLGPTVTAISEGATRTVPVPRVTLRPNAPGNDEVDAYVARNWRRYIADWAVDTHGWRCVCGRSLRDYSCTSCGRSFEECGPLLREVAPDPVRAVWRSAVRS